MAWRDAPQHQMSMVGLLREGRSAWGVRSATETPMRHPVLTNGAPWQPTDAGGASDSGRQEYGDLVLL